MKSALTLLLCVGLVSSAPVEEQKKRYDGHRVIRIDPTDETHVNALKFLHAQDIQGVDFWREPVDLGRPVDIHVQPEVSANVTSFLENLKIEWSLMIPDLQKLVDEEEASQQEASKKRARRDFDSYKRYSEVMSFLDNLASSCRDMCSTEVIGKSHEGRDLKLIKIGTAGTNKPSIWIDGGYHAREWISPATAMFVAQELVSGSNRKNVRSLLDAFDWYILPVANPDGYEYSHQSERYWRKTRSPNSGSSCVGTDANRNWDFHWGESGTSSNPCSDTFGGSKAASEIEVSTVANYIVNKRSFKAYFSFHAYGQMWLTPYGYTRQLPADYDEIEAKGLIGAAALRQVYGTRYVVGSAARVLYASSGGSDDWGYGVGNCDYAYTLELRDEGNYGFALPASQIFPTGKETWAGIQAFGNAIATRYRRGG